MYWSKADDISVPLVAKQMPRNKFIAMKKYVHVADNENLTKGDKMAKVRPLIDAVNESLQQFGIFHKELSIDEQMVPYYGRHSCKMFLRGKPIRFGYKLWLLCSSTGYPFNIDVYCGKNSEKSDVPLGTKVVKKMLQCVNNPSCHDNFFISYDFLMELRDMDFHATGTVREVRLKKCTLEEIPNTDKIPQGKFDYKSDRNILIVKWKDSKVVCVASSHDTVNPMLPTKRFSQSQKKYIQIPQPAMIRSYNQYMDSGDLLDRFISQYRPVITSKTWYCQLL